MRDHTRVDDSSFCVKIVKSEKEMYQCQLDYFFGEYLGSELRSEIIETYT